MRRLLAMALILAVVGTATSQPKKDVDPKEPLKRFGLRLAVEVYPQDSPQKALYSVLRAIDKDRYDYLIAHLLEPGYVAEQMAISYPQFEKQAKIQVENEQLAKNGFDRLFISNRVRDIATQASFDNLMRRIRNKLDNDPDALKDLKQMLREGKFADAGETSVGKLDNVKDRALYFKKIGDRWFIENKIQE